MARKKAETPATPLIRGFKAFDDDWSCRGYRYEVGQTYTHDGPVKACSSGFHFCENPFDLFGYYPPTSKFAEVEGSGTTDRRSSDGSKTACSELHIKAEIGLHDMISAGVKFILDKVTWTKEPQATNTGHRSAATNTGHRSAATNTGDQSAATNTGDQSAATNTGYQSAATNTGDQSAATNTGYQSAATNTGHRSAATNTGHRSAATNTGHQSAATNTGYQSAATNTGYQSAAAVDGKESIACGLGIENKAKGAKGCWLVLSEWYQDKDCEWHIKDVRSVQVDGETIKADTYYTLRDGRFTEASHE
jgi:hypothetical protein